MPLDLLTSDFILLVIGGYFISIFAVVIGGSAFFSIPFLQLLFPGISFGAIIGNMKVGSLVRSIGSTISTHKQIQYFDNLKIAAVALVGTIIGASIIADLDDRWLFPILILAVLLTLCNEKIVPFISQRTFCIVTFFMGLYTGVLGAGIGIFLIVLLRLKYQQDEQIAFVKIQARFLEFVMVIAAVAAHSFHGNLMASIWVPWCIGALAGGITGGILLNKMGKLTGRTQKYILYFAFAFAIIVAGYRFFNL